MTIAVNDLVILQGASEAPISAAISAKRATQENRQSATARKGWVVWCPKALPPCWCGLDPGRSDYARFADFCDPDGNSWVLKERGYHST